MGRPPQEAPAADDNVRVVSNSLHARPTSCETWSADHIVGRTTRSRAQRVTVSGSPVRPPNASSGCLTQLAATIEDLPMSNVDSRGRSYRAITRSDLRRLARIARQDRETLFKTHPQWATLYAQRVMCVALCQGAALHYLDRKTGINDFDVYTFYRKHPAKDWYARRIKRYDFGDPKFGQSLDRPDFVGRRVDCCARSIDIDSKEGIEAAIQQYLQEGRTESAKQLAAKAVILLEPNCGKVIWPR